MSEELTIEKVNESFIRVTGSDAGLEMDLFEHFSHYVDGYKFMPAYKSRRWDGKIRKYNIQDKTIHLGLYPDVVEFANEAGYKVNTVKSDVYGLPLETQEVDVDQFNKFVESLNIHIKGNPATPYDYQIDACIESIKKKRLILLSPTSSGKSLIIYILARWYMEYEDDRKILLIVPTTNLVRQMQSDFADYSSHDESFDIERDFHMIFSGQDKEADSRIFCSTWQSIYKLAPLWFSKFGITFGDEAHQYQAKSLQSIFEKLKNCDYRIGTTGSVDQSNELTRLNLKGVFGPLHQVIRTHELMDDGTVETLKINVIRLNYSDELKQKLVKCKYQDEIDFIVQNESRNKFIRNLATKCEGNTLILYNYVEKHGKPLYELISSHLKDTDRNVYIVHGGVDSKEREELRHILETEKDAIVVASLGTFSTGISVNNINNLIFASPTKSLYKVLQSIGRGLRLSTNGYRTTLYDIGDDFSWKKKVNHTLRHLFVRLKIYNSEKFDHTIYTVDVND